MDGGLLLKQVIREPSNVAARRVYAEWLAEQGDPRGELIQLQCAMEEVAPELRMGLEARANALLDLYERQWSAAVRAIGPLGYSSERPGPAGARFRFRRGFIDHVRMTARDFAAHARALADVTPLKSARLTELTRDQVRALARCEALERVDELELELGGPADEALADLLASPFLARLTRLALFGQIGPESARALARHPKLAALESLRIEDAGTEPGPTIGPHGAAALASAPFAPNLKELALVGQRIGPAGARALAAFSSLRTLSLERNEIGPVGAQALHALTGLVSLELGGNSLTPKGAALVAGGPFPHLERLDLSGGNKLGPKGLAALLEALALPKLNALGLASCGLSVEGMRLVVSAKSLAGLRELNLAANQLGDEGLSVLSHAELPNLERLDLSYNGGREGGALALAHGKLLSSVRELDVRHNKLGSGGAKALALSGELTSLRALWLGNNWIGVEGIRRLLGSPAMPALERLYLDQNNFGSEGLAALTRSPYLKQLQALSTWGVDRSAVKALADSEHAQSLKELSFAQSVIGEEGAVALAESAKLSGLRWLSFSHCAVGEEGARALRRRFGHRVSFAPDEALGRLPESD